MMRNWPAWKRKMRSASSGLYAGVIRVFPRFIDRASGQQRPATAVLGHFCPILSDEGERAQPNDPSRGY